MCSKPALNAASAACAERLPLRHNKRMVLSLPTFYSSSFKKRGLRLNDVPVAQATWILSGT